MGSDPAITGFERPLLWWPDEIVVLLAQWLAH